MSPMNRHIPLFVAVGVGIFSGMYIWEPMLKKYQRESQGTWQYDVVQKTRAQELNQHADAVADATEGSTQTTPAAVAVPQSSSSTAPVPGTAPAPADTKTSSEKQHSAESSA
ncbi:hypothetical protein BGZ99_005698 [Dissophora globulifera]|uniref:Uncharacterized protein n=1 Tax=Dissophora globulifera TaxID=979702 RepID=A0A9P6REJ8_9FUNG|nr:hypothetical protein BGZ99_005698 [Dissophora globulifera]